MKTDEIQEIKSKLEVLNLDFVLCALRMELKFAEYLASKYDDNQPRDDHGRWTRFLNIDVAVDLLNAQAIPFEVYEHLEKDKKGKCAKRVREAIEAGLGVPLKDHPKFAKDYDPYLSEKYNFEKLKTEELVPYIPKKGDIVVFQSPKSDKKSRGHIQMYNGEQWVSDFFQPGEFWPNKIYEKDEATYSIFRPIKPQRN